MTLLVRTFLAEPGCRGQLMERLQGAAAGLIQDRHVEAILICQEADAAERILWIESGHRDFKAGIAADISPAPPAHVLRETPPRPRALEFLDGFYRFPLPPCDVWSLEVHFPPDRQDGTMGALLDLLRCAATDSHIAGASLYRVAGDPALVLGFVALTPGVIPGEHFRGRPDYEPSVTTIEPVSVWRRLAMTWTVGRLSSGAGPLPSHTRYPRAAFWARAQSVASSPVAPGEGKRPGAVAAVAHQPLGKDDCISCGGRAPLRGV